MKNITVLGVTGSIGMQTVDVVKNHSDRFKMLNIFVWLIKKMPLIYKKNIPINIFIMEPRD